MSSGQPLETRASAPALELRRICKSFGGNRALDNASIAVDWGEVHALLGENGAGKSTIMNVASGIYAADEGETLIDGEKARIQSPLDATRYGIGMVHQHFRLVRNFTVAQNILLACEGRDVGIRNIRDANREVAAMGERVGLRADPGVPVVQTLGGRAAAGRDPQGAPPGRAHRHSRRADGGAHGTGGRVRAGVRQELSPDRVTRSC